DGDGYLEYLTRSSVGPTHQGWKDSGDAIVHNDGSLVRTPAGTCELQGYWYAAQQLMAIMCWALGAREDAKAYWRAARELKQRFNHDWWPQNVELPAMAMDADKQLVHAAGSNVGHCLASGILEEDRLPSVVGRLFQPDLFSGWGVRTLSSTHAAYDPLSYHRGSVWAVENATIAFGLRRFGFDARALDVAKGLFDLAQLYPDLRIPEAVGGYGRVERATPSVYPRANSPQLWNATSMPLLVHTLTGLQPVAPLDLLVVDPALPSWLPEIEIRGLRIAGAKVDLRFWRDRRGASHVKVLRRQGTIRLVRQPPLESTTVGLRDRFSALVDYVVHR
ncbi:MAG: amylo-alpha-1,6-glucosidase, partial [Gemmatimonadota bacterium]